MLQVYSEHPCVAVFLKQKDKINTMANKKYSEAAQEKIGEVMHEFKEGKLKSSSGEKVTDRKQAIAIGISEAEQEGLKVPKKQAQKKSETKKK